MGAFLTFAGSTQVGPQVCVEHGHLNQAGRLDLVISLAEKPLAVIEVKTRPYTALAQEKHQGYRRSVPSPDTDLILLAVDPPDSDRGDFRFLSWAKLCVALRRIALALLAPERIMSTSLILAFVGAVEQNLLGLVSPLSSKIPIGKVPLMVDHLAKALQTDYILGNS